MNIPKISLKNNAFGLKLGPNLENHFKYTAGTLNKVAEGNMLKYIIDAHADNTNFIKQLSSDKTIEFVSEDEINNIRRYRIHDNNQPVAQISTHNDNLWYAKLVEELKRLHKQNII